MPRQAPPLAAQMGHDARRDAPLEAKPALQPHIAVKQPPLFAPGKGKAQGKAFHIQPADGPADILGGDAFDEVGAGAFIKVFHQLINRAQRQT